MSIKTKLSAMLLTLASAGVEPSSFVRADVVVPPTVITAIQSWRVYNAGQNLTEEASAVDPFENPEGYTGGEAFTASIGTGDTVVLRLQAPTGHQFRIRHRSPHNYQLLMFSFYHQSSGSAQFGSPHGSSIRFENGVGTAPVPVFALTHLSEAGNFLGVDAEYNVVGDFTFTAFEARITVTAPLVPEPRNYFSVNTAANFLIGVIANTPGNVVLPDVLSIEPQVGACCIGGACTIVAYTDCTGEFLGANTVCFPAARGGRVVNACCPADFDGNSSVGVPDIFAFLSAWFSACP